MTTRTHCEQLTDHLAHPVTFGRNQLQLYRCPGRFTPSAHRPPGPKLKHAMDSDPFAGVDSDAAPSIWD